MEYKQTPVEWLVEQLPIRMKNYLQEEIEKAKEMEKECHSFTPEQLNQLLSDVIKDTLETAAEKAEPDYWKGDCQLCGSNQVDKSTITNTFEETFKKYKVC